MTIKTSIYPTMPRVYTPPRLTVALSEPPPQEPHHERAKAAAMAKAKAKLDAASAAHKLWTEMKAEEDAGVPARNLNHRKRKIEAVESVFLQEMAVAEEAIKEAEEMFYQA